MVLEKIPMEARGRREKEDVIVCWMGHGVRVLSLTLTWYRTDTDTRDTAPVMTSLHGSIFFPKKSYR